MVLSVIAITCGALGTLRLHPSLVTSAMDPLSRYSRVMTERACDTSPMPTITYDFMIYHHVIFNIYLANAYQHAGLMTERVTHS